MKVKVCGMRTWENIQMVAGASPDYIGFIHYEDSPRDVSKLKMKFVVQSLPEYIEPVAVFVNADVDFAKGKIEENGYTHVQLHGNESPEYCRNLMSEVKIIKAFQINKEFDFASLQDYEQVCDYYLFDTSGAEPGGTGKKFDWDLLQKYEGKKPFFLSGGIGEDDVPKIKSLVMPALFAIDVNSKFEIEPAVKDSGMLGVFIKAIRNE